MIRAGGGVVERPGAGGVEILLIHRTRYSDNEWALPKGKVETGESLEQTAVREVREEAGCVVRLGEFLGATRYEVKGKPKEVSYWRMALVEQRAIQDTSEVAGLRWLPPADALDLMSYDSERELIARVYPEKKERQ